MKRLSVHLGDTIYESLRQLAAREGRSMASQVAYMIKRDSKWEPSEYTCERGHKTLGGQDGDPPKACVKCPRAVPGRA